MELKDSWKKAGKDIGGAGKSFGKAFLNTVKKGVRAVSDWADDDDKPEGAKEEQEIPAVEAEIVSEGEDA